MKVKELKFKPGILVPEHVLTSTHVILFLRSCTRLEEVNKIMYVNTKPCDRDAQQILDFCYSFFLKFTLFIKFVHKEVKRDSVKCF